MVHIIYVKKKGEKKKWENNMGFHVEFDSGILSRQFFIGFFKKKSIAILTWIWRGEQLCLR